MTSPALTSQLHLGLISHVLQDLSRKRLKTLMQCSFPLQGTDVTVVTERFIYQFLTFIFKILHEVNLYPTCGQSAQDQRACLLCGSFKYMTSIRSTSEYPQIFLQRCWQGGQGEI